MIEELIQKYQNTNDFQNILLLLKYLYENNLNNIAYLLGKYFYNEYHLNSDFIILLGDISFSLLKFDEAYEHYESVYNLDLSKNDEDLIKDKLIKTIPFIKNNFTSYNVNIINKILNKKVNRDSQKITFSITTCKRFDLFSKTINSFLNCCTDLEMIDEWILVDDNSSNEDRKLMQEQYPFFSFIFKDESQKGHPKSMNIIKNKVKTKYLFHMEDDWIFFKQDNYLEKCFKILEFSERYNLSYGQVLINRNYAEVEKDLKYIGGVKYKTDDNQTFIEHQYLKENSKELDEFLKDYDLKNNTYDIVYYWPHFSFRPSLLRTDIYKLCGDFRNDVFHFEREYANVYNSLGLKSVFLPGFYSFHSGRLTSQIDNKEIMNAYELNQTLQYQKNFQINYNLENIDCYVVNLNRRKDRFLNFERENKDKISFLNCKRYSAVDGKKVKHSRQLEFLFNNNTYDWNAGAIGCALSHIDLWINFLKSNKELLVIFEDDAKVTDNFKVYFNNILKNLNNITCDLMFLGHHSTCLTGNEFIIKTWEGERIFKETLGGTFGYLINKNGCRKILDFIEKEGMINCIDTMMLRAEKENNLKIWVCEPLLIYSTCYQFDKKNDTDIQYETYKIYRTPKKRLEIEIELFKKLKLPFRHFEDKNGIEKEHIIIYNKKNKDKINGYYYDISNEYFIGIPNNFISSLDIFKIKNKNEYSIYDILNN